ncbi:MAG: MFS transporter [Burkholderiaceae bacterium]|jgi:predicted MFS family arabinose efflux permease|nr:MFS transporter [Burkholderiaceae bacterium]
MSFHRGFAGVLGGILLNMAFGGLYAFSALVPALEGSASLTRSDTGMMFALSTTCFMTGVWACGPLLKRWRASTIATGAGLGAAVGLLSCAWVQGAGVLIAGYSGIYGLSVGIGYALSLAALSKARMKWPGAAAGIVVASFAMGSVCWAQALGTGIASIGLSSTLVISALVVASLAGVAGQILKLVDSQDAPFAETSEHRAQGAQEKPPVRHAAISNGTLWLTFFSVASAGLTVIGQSLQLLNSDSVYFFLGLSVVAVTGGMNGFGRLLGGFMADRISPAVLLGAPLLLTVAGLGVLFARWNSGASYGAILIVALVYGWYSAIVPALVMKGTGQQEFSKVYGKIFTAWGLAGLIAPWFSGWVFSQRGSYDLALVALALLNLLALSVLLFELAKCSLTDTARPKQPA